MDGVADWQKHDREARASGDVCAYCGATFGRHFGQVAVTCASCGRPYRTRRMEREAADMRQQRGKG